MKIVRIASSDVAYAQNASFSAQGLALRCHNNAFAAELVRANSGAAGA